MLWEGLMDTKRKKKERKDKRRPKRIIGDENGPRAGEYWMSCPPVITDEDGEPVDAE